MSQSTLAVLRVLIDSAGRPAYGIQIGKEAGLASGTLYPILDRLTTEGWVEGAWEEGEPAELGRPRRRYYKLTALGAEVADIALRAAHAQTTPRTWLTPLPAR